MSNPANKSSFMVYTLKGKRWELHEVYNVNKMNQAIQDARALERLSTIDGVKVVKEDVHPGSDKSKEAIVFSSQKKPNKPGKISRKKSRRKPSSLVGQSVKKPATRPLGPSASGGVKLDSQTVKQKTGPAIYTFSQYLARYFGIILLSIIAGLMVVGIASLWLQETQLDFRYQLYIMVGLFFFGFFIFIMAVMPMLSSTKTGANVGIFSGLGASKPVPGAMPEHPHGQEVNSYSDFRNGAARMARIDSDEEDDEDQDDELTEDQVQGETEDQDNIFEIEEVAGPLKKQKSFVLSYLRPALRLAEIDRNNLDNFNKFGVTLFMAGACDALSNARSLDSEITSQVISETVKYMGLADSHADSFSDKVPEYLLADPKYMEIFESGRDAMKAHLGSNANGFKEFRKAIEVWNQPKQKDTSDSPVTVLFTDIVGSTRMTQTLGDQVAQKILHVHNSIVRSALRNFSGREIKHTGDGIMASFANTASAVSSAAEMQKETVAHNKANPTQLLGLKIGLNTGEPIAEDNDLFGSTVQLASRIVDKASASQVFVSEIVHGICHGKNFNFENRGVFEIKGFADDLVLYELMWDPDAAKLESTSGKKPGITKTVAGADGEATIPPMPEAPSGEETAGEEKSAQEPVVQSPDHPDTSDVQVAPVGQLAVFRADIIDYDRLVRMKRNSTDARLDGVLEYMVKTIKSNGGKMVRHDDGVILSTFKSTAEAVMASVTVQTKMQALNKNMSEKNRVQIRIAILCGGLSGKQNEISDDDLEKLGNLNSQAQPGGLCVSGDVVEHIGDKVEVAFMEGDDKPEHLYRWQP